MSRTVADFDVLYYGGFKLPDEKARGVHAIHTCASLARAGVPVTMLLRDAPTAADALAPYDIAPDDRLEIVGVRRSRVRRWLGTGAAERVAIARVMRRRRPLVVYTMDFPGLRMTPTFLRSRRRYGHRVVFEAHNLTSVVLEEEAERQAADAERAAHLRRRAAWSDRTERASYPHLDGLVTNSRGTLAAIAERCGAPQHALALPNGVDVDRFRDAAPTGEPIDVLYTGSIDGWKGVETLIDAAHDLDGARVAIAGFGADALVDEHRRHIADAGVGSRIDWLGYVPHRDVPGLLARARVVCVLTSGRSREGREFTCPMKLLEAMASRRAIVATDLPAIRELVQDGVHASLFEADDPKSLARAIRGLLDAPDRAAALGRAAGEAVASWSWDARAERLRAFLESVLAR